MARTEMYDPQTSEARSAWLAGLTEICNKLSGVLNMDTGRFEDLPLPELFIADEDRYRIYQAPLGNKLWLQTPAPIIKKNGVVIFPDSDGFEIDFLGGSIIFSEGSTLSASDAITASATYVIDKSATITSLSNQLNTLGVKVGNFKGSFETYEALNTSYPVGTIADYAIVQNDNSIYVWNTTSKTWENTYKTTDLSNYLTATQIQALLAQKEDSISPKGNTAADDLFYFGGRKTWIRLMDQILGVALTGLSTADKTTIQETDTLLAALGKLQGQINTYIHPISGTSAPEETLEGEIGQDYINTSNGAKYHLTEIHEGETGTTYIWEKYADESFVTDSIQTAILSSWSSLY